MSEFWDVRCTLPARGYKPGPCHALLFRITSTGGIECKCHTCHEITMVHKSELDQYQVEDTARI